MIEKLLKDWKGKISIDDITVEASKIDFKTLSSDSHIVLRSNTESRNTSVAECVQSKSEYRITVKRYMTEKANPGFDFMAKWNNDNPMPLRTMIGTEEKETKGMVYMKLHGQAEPVVKCMRCGRTLTNEVSRLYGIGPECITKIPFLASLNIDDVEGIKEKLVDVTWEGWVIKSAILEKEKL